MFKNIFKISHDAKKVLVILFLGCILALVISLQSCSLMKSLPDDNAVEEYAEDIFKDYTGMELDITGESPEKQ